MLWDLQKAFHIRKDILVMCYGIEDFLHCWHFFGLCIYLIIVNSIPYVTTKKKCNGLRSGLYDG